MRLYEADFGANFATNEMQALINYAKLVLVITCQSMFGAASQKPTCFAVTSYNAHHLKRDCNHRSHDLLVYGLNRAGGFKSAATEAYPPALNEVLSHMAAGHIARAVHGNSLVPCGPRERWRWPEPSLGFLDETLRCVRKGACRQ